MELKSNYTAITQQDGEWWVGWIEEIPGVNAQERSKEELEFNRKEARASAGGGYTEELVTL